MKVVFLCNNKTIHEKEFSNHSELPSVNKYIKFGSKSYQVTTILPLSHGDYAVHMQYIGDDMKLTKLEFMTTRLMTGLISHSNIEEIERDKKDYVELCKSIAIEIINQCK